MFHIRTKCRVFNHNKSLLAGKRLTRIKRRKENDENKKEKNQNSDKEAENKEA